LGLPQGEELNLDECPAGEKLTWNNCDQWGGNSRLSAAQSSQEGLKLIDLPLKMCVMGVQSVLVT
jgi:hypothetical protein